MTADQLDEFEVWVASRPPKVQATIRRYCYPVCYCYRLKSEDGTVRGHYRLHSFEEPEDETKPVTVKLDHGRDSFLPNHRVFGIDPADLVPCNCGQWEPS